MAWWTVPAIMEGSKIGGRLIDQLFGGGDVSPELSRLIEQVGAMMEEGLPEEEIGRISAPYVRLRKGIEQTYARQAGASGLKSAIIQRQVTTPQAGAIAGAQTRFKTGLLDMLGRLQMGAEPYRQQGKMDWGSILGSAGAGFGQAYGEEQEFNQFMELLEQIYGGGEGVVPSIGGEDREKMSYPGYGGKPKGWWD